MIPSVGQNIIIRNKLYKVEGSFIKIASWLKNFGDKFITFYYSEIEKLCDLKLILYKMVIQFKTLNKALKTRHIGCKFGLLMLQWYK